MKDILTKTLLFGLFAVLLLAGGALLFAGNEQSPPRTLQEFLGPPEMSKVDPGKPLREQTRIFELAGRRFAIPIMYIDGRPDPGEHQDSMLLEVIWPEMRSIYEIQDRQEYDRLNQEHRIGWILIEPASLKPSLDWQNENGVNGLTKFESVGIYDGMEKGRWYRGPKESPRLWAEVYVERESDGRILSFNRCRRGEGVLFPICEHKFIDGGLLYQISYNEETFFAEWRQQRQRTIDFLHRLEIDTKPIDRENNDADTRNSRN